MIEMESVLPFSPSLQVCVSQTNKEKEERGFSNSIFQFPRKVIVFFLIKNITRRGGGGYHPNTQNQHPRT